MKYLLKSKHNYNYYMLLLIAILVSFGCSTDETQTVATFENLVMYDEFEADGAPSSTLWDYNIGTGANGWGNNELQYYTDRSDNVKVENGMLHIIAREESYMGSGYTSARILTKGKYEQQYGRFEARMKLPWGQGLWPAFWLLGADIDNVGWPQCGEIDIMEYRGQKPTIALSTIHGPGYSASEGISDEYILMNDRYDNGFNLFAVEWFSDRIDFFVNDALYHRINKEDVPGEWVFDNPFYMILNLAVGGSFLGSPNAETVFPQTMLVDYVRVYRDNG